MASCVRNIDLKNIKIWHYWFSSYSRKCRGCFL